MSIKFRKPMAPPTQRHESKRARTQQKEALDAMAAEAQELQLYDEEMPCEHGEYGSCNDCMTTEDKQPQLEES